MKHELYFRVCLGDWEDSSIQREIVLTFCVAQCSVVRLNAHSEWKWLADFSGQRGFQFRWSKNARVLSLKLKYAENIILLLHIPGIEVSNPLMTSSKMQWNQSKLCATCYPFKTSKHGPVIRCLPRNFEGLENQSFSLDFSLPCSVKGSCPREKKAKIKSIDWDWQY